MFSKSVSLLSSATITNTTWLQALKVLKAYSIQQQQNVSRSSFIIHQGNKSTLSKELLFSDVERQPQPEQQQKQKQESLELASEILANWIRAESFVNPTSTANVCQELLSSATTGITLFEEFPIFKDAVVSAIGNRRVCDSQTTSLLLSQIINQTGENKSLLTPNNKLALAAAASRTSWASTSASSKTPTFEIFAALQKTPTIQQQQKSTNLTPSVVENAISSAFARGIAPQLLNSKKASKISEKSFREHLERLEIKKEYSDFLLEVLRLQKEEEEDKNDLATLKERWEKVPLKAGVNSIFARVLIQRQQWSKALDFVKNEMMRMPQQRHPSILSFHIQQLEASRIGIEAMTITSCDSLETFLKENLNSKSSNLPTSLRIQTAKSVFKIRKNVFDTKKEEEILGSLLKKNQQQQQSGSNQEEILPDAPTSEIGAQEAAASHALALSLSSTWKTALQDFSFILSAASAFDITTTTHSNSNDEIQETRQQPESNISSAFYSLIQKTLSQLSPSTRLRLCNSILDGGKIDLLQTLLRVAAGSEKSSSSDEIFTKREAFSLIVHSLGSQRRDVSTLKQLREFWPKSCSGNFDPAKLALKVESKLRAKELNALLFANSSDQRHLLAQKASQFLQLTSMILNSKLPLGRVELEVLDKLFNTKKMNPQIALLLKSQQNANLERQVKIRMDRVEKRKQALRDETPFSFQELLDAKFPVVACELVYTKISQRLSKMKNQNIELTTQHWKSLCGEISRLSANKKAINALLTCVTTIVQKSLSEKDDPFAVIAENLLFQLSMREQKLQSVSAALRKRHQKQQQQENDNSSQILNRLKKEQEIIGASVLTAIVSTSASNNHSMLEKKREALGLLTRYCEFNNKNSVEGVQQKQIDKIRANILKQVGKMYHHHHSSTSTSLMFQNYEIVLRKGWIGGAKDVLKTVQLQQQQEQSENIIIPKEGIANMFFTITPSSSSSASSNKSIVVAVDRNNLLWLLQQSQECRDFVECDTRRILDERRRKKETNSSSSTTTHLLPQTVSTALWKSLCHVFESAVTQCRFDGNEDEQEENRRSTRSNNNKSSCTFVLTCANLLATQTQHEGDRHAVDSVVPFCFEKLIFDEEGKEGTKNKLRTEMILNACHIENDSTRMKLLKIISSARNDEKGDCAVIVEKIKKMAIAEGLMKNYSA